MSPISIQGLTVHIKNWILHFARHKRANVAIIFAFSAMGLTFTIGGVVDLSRVNMARRQMQDAADSAALRALRLSQDGIEAERQAAYVDFDFNGTPAPHGLYDLETHLDHVIDGNLVTEVFTASGKVPALFGYTVGMDYYPVQVVAKAQSKITKSEIAFVLDVTGSMASSGKIENLKSSVDTVLSQLVDDQGVNVSDTHVAIVPFNLQVKVEPSTTYNWVNYGTQTVSEACTGLNSKVCTTAWDVLDKVCITATNMDDCRAKAKGAYKTSTSGSRTYYYVTYKSYQGSGSNYRIYTYNEVLYANSGGSLTYYSRAVNNYNATSSAPAAVVDSGYTSIASGALNFKVSYTTGYGAIERQQISSTSYGDTKIVVYPAMADAKANWAGCIMDRDQPYDVSETAPTASTPATLYPAQACAYTNLLPMTALSNNIASARSLVQSFQTGGNTNIGIGMQWGIELLSPSEPKTGGVDFGDGGTTKYLILVTDGENTQNRWSTNTNTIDSRTELACTRAKQLGITVFVVRVMEGDSTLLRQCASKSEYFYDLSSASQLNEALSNVFQAIRKTRLTQ